MNQIKISIITTCLDSEKSIPYTLDSVSSQTYKNIEHIIINGGSTDGTGDILKKYKLKKKKVINVNTSIYEAINIGITKSTGDYIIILHSDDILNDKDTIKNIVYEMKEQKYKIYLADILYFNNYDFNIPVRQYSAKNFRPWMFRIGLMPPHPGAFIHRSIAKKIFYNTKYLIASDFDYLLQLLLIKKNSYLPLNIISTRMRTGGISGKNLKAHYISGKEIYKSLSSFNLLASNILINLRYIIKLYQFFNIKKNIFIYQISNYYKKILKYDFKILSSCKLLNFKSNFVLSALNLAYLGSYSNNEVKNYDSLIHWPDGMFGANFKKKLKKIPGRQLLDDLIIPSAIKKITVFGFLHPQGYEYLKKKFKKKIFNYKLPYGDSNLLIKKGSPVVLV